MSQYVIPDGSFARLPCARHKDGGSNQDFEVVTQPTEIDAWDWGKLILPDRFSVWEVRGCIDVTLETSK
jgi:hypothetical protein